MIATELLDVVLLLAQDAGKAAEAPANQGQGSPFFGMLPMLLTIAVIFYFIVWRPQRREQHRRQQMLSELKKNDRIVTIGGIIGTVANVSSDGGEVTIKVDDNTRLRMRRSSIAEVLKSDEEEEKPGA